MYIKVRGLNVVQLFHCSLCYLRKQSTETAERTIHGQMVNRVRSSGRLVPPGLSLRAFAGSLQLSD